MIAVKVADTTEAMQQVFRIRFKVFVDEQMVLPDEEYDHYEQQAIHFLATVYNVPAGTARWIKKGDDIKLERFAVLPEFRNTGVGSALVSAAISNIEAQTLRPGSIYLHAQLAAIPFYEKMGFVAYGPLFDEAGIWHRRMMYALNGI